jgi:hypothetical protein
MDGSTLCDENFQGKVYLVRESKEIVPQHEDQSGQVGISFGLGKHRDKVGASGRFTLQPARRRAR